ncbi:MAG TPA: thermostable hemolysin [Steroidobacteraceae bacterium]|nr:thermostable hemolysin [Steroidobacteraceae bacterium]
MNHSTAAEDTPKPTPAVPRERAGCRRPLGRTLRMSAVADGEPGRDALEEYVRDAFRRKHDATVTSFMPTLLSFRDLAGELRGVVGLRGATDQPLYLEQYLGQPVDSAIAAATGRNVRRREVVEVGNLAGANCRTAVRMVALLPGHLLSCNYRWIVFTATSAVREILLGFGAPLVELARADAARIAIGADQWGRYYESDPRVFAGHLPDSRLIGSFDAGNHDH